MTATRTGVVGGNLAALVLATLVVTGCDARLRETEGRGGADVDIRTPLGALTVRTGKAVPDTGLPIYAGARPSRDDDEGHNANVAIDTPLFALHVAAAKFESADSVAQVLDFYRAELGKYGDVIECRGDVDFEGRGRHAEPRCRDRRRSRQVQLVVGTEDHHRMVAVKPTATDTEFSLIHVDTRKLDW